MQLDRHKYESITVSMSLKCEWGLSVARFSRASECDGRNWARNSSLLVTLIGNTHLEVRVVLTLLCKADSKHESPFFTSTLHKSHRFVNSPAKEYFFNGWHVSAGTQGMSTSLHSQSKSMQLSRTCFGKQLYSYFPFLQNSPSRHFDLIVLTQC